MQLTNLRPPLPPKLDQTARLPLGRSRPVPLSAPANCLRHYRGIPAAARATKWQAGLCTFHTGRPCALADRNPISGHLTKYQDRSKWLFSSDLLLSRHASLYHGESSDITVWCPLKCTRWTADRERFDGENGRNDHREVERGQGGQRRQARHAQRRRGPLSENRRRRLEVVDFALQGARPIAKFGLGPTHTIGLALAREKPPTRAACYSTVSIRSKRGRRPRPLRRLKPRA